MSEQDRIRWDQKYRLKKNEPSVVPSDWLREILADRAAGRAWDVACGLGQNSLFLASLGWNVDGVDVSAVGLEEARRLGESSGMQVNWISADLDQYVPPASVYDLVIVFRFLDRVRLPVLIERSLKPGGFLVYETFVEGQLERDDNHLAGSAFVLERGELPQLFPEFEVVSYREQSLPDRTVARLFARKPEILRS